MSDISHKAIHKTGKPVFGKNHADVIRRVQNMVDAGERPAGLYIIIQLSNGAAIGNVTVQPTK